MPSEALLELEGKCGEDFLGAPDTHRYTVFVEWDQRTLRPRWEAVYSRELYDHSSDTGLSFDGVGSEPINLAFGKPTVSDAAIIKKLHKVIITQFSSDY